MSLLNPIALPKTPKPNETFSFPAVFANSRETTLLLSDDVVQFKKIVLGVMMPVRSEDSCAV